MASWTDKINAALKIENQHWRKDAKNAVETYRKAKNASGFNILWPNTQLKHAAVFARPPKPVVRNRFVTDPTIGQVSLMLERALEYQMDIQPYKQIMDCVVLDWILPGRGVPRVRYMPKYIERDEPVFTDDQGNYFSDSMVSLGRDEIIIRGDEAFHRVEEVASEEVPIEHVSWPYFVHDPQELWPDVEWIAFYHKITREDAIKAFGKKAAEHMAVVGAEESRSLDGSGRDQMTSDLVQRLGCWEVWDRTKGKVQYISEGGRADTEKTLERYEDPYNLRNFYPIPRPILAVQTPGTTIPICEYSLYEEQARELNIATTRLKELLRQVRVKIAYDPAMGEGVKSLARSDNNVMVPVENWSAFMERGGIDGVLGFFPFERAAQAAAVLSEYRSQLLDTIYEISGLSDIMRGSSDSRETATAQQIKSQFGGLRLRPMQSQLQQMIKQTMEIQVELMAEKFDMDTFAAISRIDPPPMAETIIRGDVTRQFAIDVETDSTLAIDDQQQKQERAEFLNALSDVLARSADAKAAGLLDQSAIGEIIKFALQPYRVSRELEETLEKFGQQPQQQQPDAQAQASMMQAQIDQARIQLDAQEMQQRAVLDAAKLQLDTEKARHDAGVDREKLMLEGLKVAASA